MVVSVRSQVGFQDSSLSSIDHQYSEIRTRIARLPQYMDDFRLRNAVDGEILKINASFLTVGTFWLYGDVKLVTWIVK